MTLYGLIGETLDHSFSYRFFREYFQKNSIDNSLYLNVELEDIAMFPEAVANLKPRGLNVTIPYKESIIPFLHELDEDAELIGAVNTISLIYDNGIKLKGHNTDCFGFIRSLPHHNFKNAAILGSGGASKAIEHALNKLDIPSVVVSRTQSEKTLTYDLLNVSIGSYDLIVNCTPVGMFPHVGECPDIDYDKLNDQHFLYDLIYNPSKTLFLRNGEKQGCSTQNGRTMLEEQAVASWKIWQLTAD